MTKLRKGLTNKDFQMLAGETRDCPILPATILLDDINREIIKVELTSIGNEAYYSYILNPYPMSHY